MEAICSIETSAQYGLHGAMLKKVATFKISDATKIILLPAHFRIVLRNHNYSFPILLNQTYTAGVPYI
jgi:hypothetical protein